MWQKRVDQAQMLPEIACDLRHANIRRLHLVQQVLYVGTAWCWVSPAVKCFGLGRLSPWMVKPPTIINQFKSIWVKVCALAKSAKKGCPAGECQGCRNRLKRSCILTCSSRSLPGHRGRKLLVFCLTSSISDWIPFTVPGLVPLLNSREYKLETRNRCCSFIKKKKISGPLDHYFKWSTLLWS